MSTNVEKTYEGWQVVDDGVGIKEFSTKEEAQRLSRWVDNFGSMDDKLAGALDTMLKEFADLEQTSYKEMLRCYREYGGLLDTT